LILEFKNIKKNVYQYTIINKETLKYQINDIVFFKLQPKIKLKVINIDMKYVYCQLSNKIYKFLPEMLLHYKYRCLLTFDNKFNISLN